MRQRVRHVVLSSGKRLTKELRASASGSLLYTVGLAQLASRVNSAMHPETFSVDDPFAKVKGFDWSSVIVAPGLMARLPDGEIFTVGATFTSARICSSMSCCQAAICTSDADFRLSVGAFCEPLVTLIQSPRRTFAVPSCCVNLKVLPRSTATPSASCPHGLRRCHTFDFQIGLLCCGVGRTTTQHESGRQLLF